MLYLLSFALNTLVVGLFLWLAGRAGFVRIGFKHAVICATVSSFAGLMPYVGWFFAIWSLFSMLHYFTRASLVPDLVVLVLLAQVFAMAAGSLLGPETSAQQMRARSERIQLLELCQVDPEYAGCETLEPY